MHVVVIEVDSVLSEQEFGNIRAADLLYAEIDAVLFFGRVSNLEDGIVCLG